MADSLEQKSFVLRISPGGIDRIPEALARNQIMIGWAKAADLLNSTLCWEEFRGIIGSTYYEDEADLRRAGRAAGHMGRFIRKMSIGDIVVVPYAADFYVAKIEGSATCNKQKVEGDTAYRRNASGSTPRSQSHDLSLSPLLSHG